MSHQVRGMGILREEFGGVSRVSYVLDCSRKKILGDFVCRLAMEFPVEGVVSSYQSLDGETDTRVWSGSPLR